MIFKMNIKNSMVKNRNMPYTNLQILYLSDTDGSPYLNFNKFLV